MRHHLKHALKHSAIAFSLLFIIIFILRLTNILPVYWSFYIKYLFFITLSIVFLSLFLRIKELPEEKREKSGWINFVSYMFLLSLIVIAVNQFLKRQIFIDFQIEIISLSIMLGFLTFYARHEKVEREIEDEKTKEERDEKKRREEFPSRFPRINRIWGLRRFVRWCYKEGWFYVTIFLLSCFLFLIFGIFHLGQFMSVDEPKWLNTRVPQLYDALEHGEWERTYINDKPGILPAFLSGITNFFLDKDNYGPLDLEIYLFWWRFPILLFNFFMLFIIYIFSKKLFNKNKALLIMGLIALNPIIIGISQLVNPDATLWSTGFLTFLSFFLHLKTNKNKYIYYTGIFFGLALLSKYFVAIFYILFFLAIYFEYLFNETTKDQFFYRCFTLVKIYIISFFIYGLLLPANWVAPLSVWDNTIGSGILSSGSFLVAFFLFLVFFELIIFKGKITYYLKNNFNVSKFIITVFSVSFAIFLLFLFINSLLNNIFFDVDRFLLYDFEIREKNQFLATSLSSGYMILFGLTFPLLIGLFLYAFLSKEKEKVLVATIFSAVGMFIIGSSMGGFVASVRYQILLYPLYSVIASLSFLKFKFKRLVVISVLLLSLVILWEVAPFYLHHSNQLNIHDTVITDAWGYGGYELAQLVNSWPNAKHLTIWSDREGFNEFFVGKTYWRGKDNPFKIGEIDYLVLTRGGNKIFDRARKDGELGKKYLYAIEAIETPILDYYNRTPVEAFYVGDNPNNYVKIVKKDVKLIV